MTTSYLLHELGQICEELRSDKVSNRNKSLDKLDSLLANSKSDLMKLYRSNSGKIDPSWKRIFNSSIDSAIEHSKKVQETEGTKTFQTQRNRNHIYSSIINRLIDYSLEEDVILLDQATILTAFKYGYGNVTVRKNFGKLFLQILERGVYNCVENVQGIKAAELSSILSYLFEMNNPNDQSLKLAVIRCICKTVELCKDYVQLGLDLRDYFPDAISMAKEVVDEQQQAEVIKLFYLLTSELSTDYHITVCGHIQDVLPTLCEFYNYRMKTETKTYFFLGVYSSLKTVYPNLQSGDYNPIGITLNENWTKSVIRKLNAIVEVESKEQSVQLQRPFSYKCDELFKIFLKTSTMIVYLMNWADCRDSETEGFQPRSKISRNADALETILGTIKVKDKNTINQISLQIFTELIVTHPHLINPSNFVTILESHRNCLSFFNCWQNLKCLRLGFATLLRLEPTLFPNASLQSDSWKKIVVFLIADTNSNSDILREKHLLMQELVRANKFDLENCTTLLNFLLINTTMRRNECVSTFKEILLNNEKCQLDKTSDIIGKLLNWLYQMNDKIDGKSLLLNIEPLNEALVAETSALMVINFLDSSNDQLNQIEKQTNPINYKYCRKYICIEEHGRDLRRAGKSQKKDKPSRCVIQSNYELLMRLLNFETSKEATIHNINVDLSRLLKMVLVLKQFFSYDIFDANSCLTCPLVKRIGFFFDNLDFQLRGINAQQISKSELGDVIDILTAVLTAICDHEAFSTFLDKQNIDGLISFCGSNLKLSEHNRSSESKKLSLKTTKLLATLCFSTVHSHKAFGLIKQQRFVLKDNSNEVLELIEIFCKQSQNEQIASWFCDKLKTMCQLYHSNVALCGKIVDNIPGIVRYVSPFQEELEVCLIIISSLLKITSKKYYNSAFAAKLINSIRQIANLCPNLIEQDNFQAICLMPVKFLSSQSVTISFAAVNTITGLMDSNWINIQNTCVDSYFTFSCQLYSKLDWNSFPMENEDIKVNSTAVSVQLLTSLFAFSAYHREVAFQELGNYCATHNLNESYFYRFRDVSDFFSCSLSALTKPYIDSLLCVWGQKKKPISTFPYFLCIDSREKCFNIHLSSICYFQIRFSSTQGLEELQQMKYGTSRQLVAKAFPFCYAFLLSNLSKNPESPSPSYETESRTLLNNLKDLGCDLIASNTKVHWGTIYHATKQLWDENHYGALFGINAYAHTPAFAMNFISLKHVLRYYLQKCYALPTTKTLSECMLMLIKSDPMAILKVFAAFKLDFSDFIFLGDRLKSFYWLCSLSEILIESTSEKIPKSGLNSTQTFFLRDILFFILKSIEKGSAIKPHVSVIHKFSENTQILKAGLHFLRQILDKYLPTFLEIIKSHLNEIACTLVSIVQKSDPSVVQEMAVGLLELLICHNADQFSDAIKQLDKFPESDIYQNLRSTLQSSNENITSDLCWTVKDFLQTTTKGVEGIRSLKKSIADEKCNFEKIASKTSQSSNLLYEILKKLMDMVRSSDTSVAMEVAKCLGEIGSVKIADFAFYFECDTNFYNLEFDYQDEMTFLAESLYRLLDKLLLQYDSASVVEMYAVCKDLASSRVGSKVLCSFPLLSLFLKQGHESVLDNYSSIASFDLVEILKELDNSPFEEFSKSFSSKVYEKCQWDSFARLCKQNFTFSEAAIVPIFKILLVNRKGHFDNILAMLEYFFSQTYEVIKNERWKETQNIYSNKRVIKYFLNICECIRIHNNWNVPINLLNVAKACIYCQAYFMGIIYLEMWALLEKENKLSKSSEVRRNPIFQEIATRVFKSIDCTDAISGFLDPLNSRLEYLNLEGDWSQVLMETDASNDFDKNLYVQTLKKNGLLLLSSSEKFANNLDYECCWRLGQWETTIENNSNVTNLHDLEFEFEKNHFNALKSINNREEVNCLSAIDKARQAIVSILKQISIECLQNIYKYLTWLQLLQQAEDFCQIQFSNGSAAEQILEKWNVSQELTYGTFNCKELVLSQQLTLYKIAGIRAGRKINEFFKDKSPIGECILKSINECKNAGNINLAIRNITILRNMDISVQLKAKALIEDAEISWKTGKSRMAKAILHNFMSSKELVLCLERIQAHRMYGELLLETNNETFEFVHQEFFIRSIELLNKYSTDYRDKVLKSASMSVAEFENFNQESRRLAFATIAKYADKEYVQLDTYLNSETFRTKVQIMIKNKEEAQSLARQSKEREKSIGINVMLRNCGIDDKEIKMVEVKRSENLLIAMENYIEFCKLDKEITSPAIYRIIALWFANKRDQKLHSKIKENIHEIPSYKFLCVINQMSARLSSKNHSFLELLEEILIRCIQDHPHHTLHKILALVFAYADDPKNKSSSDRVDVAKKIISKVKNKVHTSCIKQMESMFTALIEFANTECGKSESLTLSDKVRKLKNLDNVHCPTMDLAISVDKNYKLTYIRKWEDHVGLVGGINAPKKLMCICSDGVSRPQLLKGKDDLRQDAVMQQVLSMVNELLRNDPETNDQNLRLRTYNIVPFSMRSGILEWCANTVPLGLYLCGDKKNEGAHKKYRPNDYTVAKCRSLSMAALKQDFNQRLQVYQRICENVKPVFHYFFFEKFLVPGIWFERRLAYTKSIATTSIVGFILGLGDRHVQNILIDQTTAEVIHIDFGIAFEQGKIMPTPETVPFRLTRDIVAPMGISETDGIFRKACEKTMKIMRKNQVFLSTILEVLLYDPSYMWKWSSQKLLEGDRDKDEDSEGKNLTAQRALLRVQDKLEGKEEGRMGGTPNVEVQVERLINEAINVHNLCRLYPGWDPYL